MNELKDCPFCGGEATTYKVGRDWHRLSVNHAPDCIIEDLTVDYPQSVEHLKLLIDDWNVRTTIPISKLEELIKQYLTLEDDGTVADLQNLINEAKQECDHEFVSGDNQVVTGCLVCIKCKCIRAK